MYERFVGLRIYNNFSWISALEELEKRGYLWASGDKPTSMFQEFRSGSLFINPNEKFIVMSSDLKERPMDCGHYITVKTK